MHICTTSAELVGCNDIRYVNVSIPTVPYTGMIWYGWYRCIWTGMVFLGLDLNPAYCWFIAFNSMGRGAKTEHFELKVWEHFWFVTKRENRPSTGAHPKADNAYLPKEIVSVLWICLAVGRNQVSTWLLWFRLNVQLTISWITFTSGGKWCFN